MQSHYSLLVSHFLFSIRKKTYIIKPQGENSYMKKSKILLLAPVFALLVSCSKAPSNYDKVKKSVPSGGEAVTETEDQGAALLSIVDGVLATLGEKTQKHVLHLDASAKHVPLALTEEEQESEQQTFHDITANLDVEFAITAPAEGSAGLKFSITDLDVNISNFLDVKDVKLSLGYQHTAAKGAFLWVDVSDENLLNAIVTVANLAGMELTLETITSIIGSGKIMVNFDAFAQMFADLIPDLVEAEILPLPEGATVEQVVESVTELIGKKFDFLKLGVEQLPGLLEMLLGILHSYVPDLEAALDSVAEVCKDYLSVAKYKTSDVVTKVAAALNLSNDQFHALVDPKEPEPKQAEGGSAIDNYDIKKLTLDAGAMVAVGHSRGEVNEPMAFESLAVSAIASYEENYLSANITEEAYYGEQAAYVEPDLSSFTNMTTLFKQVVIPMLEQLIRGMIGGLNLDMLALA